MGECSTPHACLGPGPHAAGSTQQTRAARTPSSRPILGRRFPRTPVAYRYMRALCQREPGTSKERIREVGLLLRGACQAQAGGGACTNLSPTLRAASSRASKILTIWRPPGFERV